MQGIWDKVSIYLIKYGIALVSALLIFLIGKWVARLVSKIVEKAMHKTKVHQTLIAFTKNLAYYIILIFVAIAALNKLGIETSSFVALVGAAGLAVGLALQGSLANFAAGVMIILFQPFKVGDTIETSGTKGVVDEIQIFNTILRLEDRRVIVPNAKVTADKVTVFK